MRLGLLLLLPAAATAGPTLRGLAGGSADERAQATLAQMTLEEKLSLVHGTQTTQWPVPGNYAGSTPAIERLGIPALHLEDGPQGVGDQEKQVTAYPAQLTVAATWNRSAMFDYAASIAHEMRVKGANVMLAPLVNLARVPGAGRQYEAMGEDPFHVAEMTKANVKGIQSQGVIGCVKHFVANEQENDRFTVSANVPERALWELYYPPFQAAVEAGVGSAMCSYNKLNGIYACENHDALTVDLKQRMGFKGWVVSDWGATHSTLGSANGGLDMEMPDKQFFGDGLRKALSDGTVPMARLDDMVRRILRSMYDVGLFDHQQTGELKNDATSAAANTLARQLAAEGTVLVKNQDGFLPLQADKLKNVAVIGFNANETTNIVGKGSGEVIPPYVVSPLQAIRQRFEKLGAHVSFASGKEAWEVEKAARDADVVLVFASLRSGEGWDRENLKIGWGQDELIAQVAGINPRTAVVVHCPGAVLMPWVDQVKAVLVGFVPGQEVGNAVTSVLFGEVNPSGKLPMTFPKADDQTWLKTAEQYPGVEHRQVYSEELLMGYRYYNAKGLEPLFPFGHGLSYTTFTYSNLKATSSAEGQVTVTFDVANSGTRAGSEVAQVYVTFPEQAGEPPLQLKGFEKLPLAPGGKQTVTVTISARDLSVWSATAHQWTKVPGKFAIAVGSSSRDLRLNTSVAL